MDPQAKDVDAYIEFAKAKVIEIKYVIDTHTQADHLSVGVGLAQATGADYCLHESADLSVDDRAAFIEKMTSGTPPKPADIEVFLRSNRTGRSQ